MLDDLHICNLNERPHWLKILAAWHHQEWVQGCSSPPSKALFERHLHDREQHLTKHLTLDSLPTSLVASIDDKPVACVSLVYYQFTVGQQAQEWLTNLFVDVEYRRQGIATQLLICVEDYAVELGFLGLQLYTRNQADFYCKRGWQQTGTGRVQGHTVSILKKTFNNG